ncbi:FixH family protein [Bacillus spongiae]|uniref:FixH family protein n=1 Tax=Bacillus spongiae TaxID=2683610 RepID=A0ABU8HAY1_9BACI
MKRLKGFWMLVSSIILILAACGNNDEKDQKDQNEETVGPIQAELSVPKTADLGEAVLIETKVTQAEELVDDADEVKYEIWMDGQKSESEMLEATKLENGHYTLEKAFEKDGKYIIQVHVTARGLHTMPKKEIVIGDDEMAMADYDDHANHDEEHSELSINFMKPDNTKAGSEVMLMSHVELNSQALENARVKFEITQDGESEPTWVETESETAGEYKAMYIFDQAGHYMINVHVEKGQEIHDHIEEMLMVTE